MPCKDSKNKKEDEFFFVVFHEERDSGSPLHRFDESFMIKIFVLFKYLLSDLVL